MLSSLGQIHGKIQGDPRIAYWARKQGSAQKLMDHVKSWPELVWRGSHWPNLGSMSIKKYDSIINIKKFKSMSIKWGKRGSVIREQINEKNKEQIFYRRMPNNKCRRNNKIRKVTILQPPCNNWFKQKSSVRVNITGQYLHDLKVSPNVFLLPRFPFPEPRF